MGLMGSRGQCQTNVNGLKESSNVGSQVAS